MKVKMEANNVLEIALRAGHRIVCNGAETFRVEETVERICNAYGVKCECMATAKGVFVSVKDAEGEKITSLKKATDKRVDLYRIELLNNFSRRVENEKPTYEEAMKMLKEIDKAPYFKFSTRLAAGSLTCFIYSLFFNGTICDALGGAVIGMIVYFLIEKISSMGFFQFLQFFISGFVIAAGSSLMQSLIPYINRDSVITGGIMVLVPGVALTNGIKDIIYGDFASGMARFGEAMLIVIAMGAGIVSALALKVGVI